MRVDRRFLNWGVFLILLGAVPLAVRQGLIPADTVSRAWSLWPLLLIAAGIGILLRRTPFEAIGGLLTAATLGLMAGALIAGGLHAPFSSCGDQAGARPFPTRNGELAEGAEVRLEMNCGELTLDSGGGTEWRVAGVDEDGGGPDVEATSSLVTIRSNDRDFDFFQRRDRWTLRLPSGIGLALNVSLNAGRATLPLGGANLRLLHVTGNAAEVRIDAATVSSIGRLEVELNAGSASIALPSQNLTGSLSVNAGSMNLCAPAGVGLRITTSDNVTAGNNFAGQGLTKNGNTWESAEFPGAAVRIELDARANAGSYTLNPSGGCDG